MPSSYQVVLWKQESFVVLRPLQIEFFRNLLDILYPSNFRCFDKNGVFQQPRLVSTVDFRVCPSNGERSLRISRFLALKLLTIEDGVVNVRPELPEHKGHSIERGI